MTSAPCPVCDGCLRLIVERIDDYSYYECHDCRLVTSLPVPGREELASFYNGFLYGLPTGDESQGRQIAIKECTAVILRDCFRIARLKPPLRVLDWGGGIGLYSNGFAELGCETTLIDIDKQACEYAVRMFGDKVMVINGDPITYRFPHRFDVVFCSHVVEHCVDVVELLEAVWRVLLPKGLLIIATPNQQCKEFYFRLGWLWHYLRMTSSSNRQCLVSLLKFLRTPWICCDPPRHVHAFNQSSLTRLLAKSRFETLKCFGEYSDQQSYSFSRRSVNWRIPRLRSLGRIARDVFEISGIRMLRAMSPNGRWGNNLVAFARPLPLSIKDG